MKKLLLLMLVLPMVFVGCKKDKFPKKVEFSIVAYGEIGVNEFEPCFVAKSQSELQEIVVKLGNPSELSKVSADFNSSQIVVVTEPQHNYGRDFSVESVFENETHVVVWANRIEYATTVISPAWYVVLTMPKNPKPVRLHTEDITGK